MDRTTNLLGALALLIGDAVTGEAARVAGRSGAAGAALPVLLQDPGIGIEALRQPLGLTQSAAVRLVDALVADGLARRGPGADARSIAVRLTTAGRREARAVLAARAELLDRAVAGLTERERRSLTIVLEKMLSAVTHSRQQAELVCRLCDLTACPQAECPVEQAALGSGS
jgi:MarR family transcriptional regulator, negative regulator of the multidrug operon emrRAB